jgi:hypothetical protein
LVLLTKVMKGCEIAPGLYHTKQAKYSRESAQYFLLSDNSAIFDPYGKSRMINGGIGCLRIGTQLVNNKELKFLSATSSGVAHKGLVVAMTPDKYIKVGQVIKTKGAVRCNLTGELCSLPADMLKYFVPEPH